MKFQELLFDNQDKTQFDDMLSQILSELDLMVGSLVSIIVFIIVMKLINLINPIN